jgi:hypothetical protein
MSLNSASLENVIRPSRKEKVASPFPAALHLTVLTEGKI